jgi:hypothetical protein
MSMQADPPQGKTINLLTGLLVGRTGRPAGDYQLALTAAALAAGAAAVRAGRMWSPRCSYMESTR